MSERGSVSRRRLLALGGYALFPLGIAACKRAAIVCSDVKGLDSSALGAREALGYLDTSPDPAKTCDQCQQYIPAAEQCGECKVLKGPIHPRGSCRAFVAR